MADDHEEELERMSLLEHLDELRKRILYSLIALGVGFVLCWAFRERIFDVLVGPIVPYLPPGPDGEPGQLHYMSVTTPIFFYMKMAMLMAVFLMSPFLMGQVWGFVAPGLYRREKLYAIPFILLGSAFFIGGGVFGYLVAFPFSVEFLLGIGEGLTPVITVDTYFRFLMTVLLGLGAMFEMPIMIFMLAQIGIVTPRFLMRHFRWAVLIIFTVAAILTPTPDVGTLCIFAVPGVLLYLLGVAAAAFANWLRGRD